MSKCANCDKTEHLKKCAKCQSEHYCSRDCQKAHWKNHKKVWGGGPTADFASHSAIPATPKGLTMIIDKPFHKLDAGTWLHDRPENDVYKLLIDTCRLRLDDDYKFEHKNTEDSVFAGEPHSLPAFKQFLRLAERRVGLLPPWWSAEKAKECVALGMNNPDDWSSLGSGPEKGDIVDHYGDTSMPMQMRMLGEQIYGSGPGGQDGTSMRKRMMETEMGA